MARRAFSVRGMVRDLVGLVLLIATSGAGAALLVLLARAVSDTLLVRTAVVLIGLPFVIYAGAFVTAPLAGRQAPSLRVFLRGLLPPPARRRRARRRG